jgi:hypothetical protein
MNKEMMYIPHWKETLPSNISKCGFLLCSIKPWWTNSPIWLPNVIIWIFIISKDSIWNLELNMNSYTVS